jgi:hypothetical protein
LTGLVLALAIAFASVPLGAAPATAAASPAGSAWGGAVGAPAAALWQALSKLWGSLWPEAPSSPAGEGGGNVKVGCEIDPLGVNCPKTLIEDELPGAAREDEHLRQRS